jgi:hypothetical protein
MSRTTFSGPVRTGKEAGHALGNTIGTVLAVQSVVVSGGAKKGFVMVPPNCELIDVMAVIETAVAGSAASYTIRIGTSADEDQYAGISVSGKNTYHTLTGVSGAAWKTLGASAANRVTVDATVANSATTGAFAGVVHITYKQGS